MFWCRNVFGKFFAFEIFTFMILPCSYLRAESRQSLILTSELSIHEAPTIWRSIHLIQCFIFNSDIERTLAGFLPKVVDLSWHKVALLKSLVVSDAWLPFIFTKSTINFTRTCHLVNIICFDLLDFLILHASFKSYLGEKRFWWWVF